MPRQRARAARSVSSFLAGSGMSFGNQSERAGMCEAATDRTWTRPSLRQVDRRWWRASRSAGLCRRMMEWATWSSYSCWTAGGAGEER